MKSLEHKEWAIVTGASSGIGKATVYALARRDVNIVIHYHSDRASAQKLEEDVRHFGIKTILIGGDFTNREEIYQAMDEAIKSIPDHKVDILVNNAGSLIHRYSFDDMPDEYWEQAVALNLSSAYYTTRAVYQHLSVGARIVLVSSVAAENGGGPGALAYAAAKGGINTLTRGLAKELASRKIRVNAISPGVIDTLYHQKFSTKERLDAMSARIVLGRIGDAQECADVIDFLTSSGSSYMTGTVVAVNGGQGLM